MTSPETVLLVSCYELGRQPLGVARPMRAIREHGYLADAIDLAVEKLPAASIHDARFVGISVPMHTALRIGIEAARKIRQLNPTCHICFFGLYAALNSDFLTGEVADSIVPGESSRALLRQIASVLGESTAGHEAGRRAGSGAALVRPSDILPDRSCLPPLERYARLQSGSGLVPAAAVEASRGCLHECAHCPLPALYEGRFFVMPRSSVLEDIRQVVSGGARHITFADPDFLNGPGHSLKIVRAMRRDHPGITFDFTAKIEHLLANRTILPELRDCGGIFVVSAAESFNDEVLKHLNKGHTAAEILQALELCRSIGIFLRPTFLPFTPWETLESFNRMLETVAEHRMVDLVDSVQFTLRLLIPPNSLLRRRFATESWMGQLSAGSLTFQWRHSDPRMDALQSALAQTVARAQQGGLSTAQIFGEIWRQAAELAGKAPAGGVGSFPEPDSDASRSPRLTEGWFC